MNRRELNDADTRRKRQVSGRELAEKGLSVVMKNAPASRLVFYMQ
jgi:repressor of nif and glnA expression